MKKFLSFIFCFAMFLVASFPSASFAAYGRPQQGKVNAFLSLYLEGSGNESGGGIRLTSAQDRDIQFETGVGFRSYTGASSFDILVGGTYFPRESTFVMGDMPVRLKISAHGGMGMSNDLLFIYDMSVGLVFSSWEDASGILAEVGYWPSAQMTDVNIPSTLSFRLGFMFAPLYGSTY